MSMGKKKTDATKKKGMALSDDALANVTGGGGYVIKLSHSSRPMLVTRTVFPTKEAAESWIATSAHPRKVVEICDEDEWRNQISSDSCDYVAPRLKKYFLDFPT